MTVNSQKINAKSALKYMLLPGIIPRAKELGGTGFGYLAFLIASVFQAVRILPATHPYLDTANIGKYSLRAVLAVAANNIEFNRKNLDQIVVFGAVILAMVLLVLQFVLFLMAVISGNAFAADAGGAPFKSIFVTEHPENDVAFLMLDYVFGIPKLFGSSALGANGDQVTPFHQGLHDLFQFYNMAILVVAVFVFMYYVIVVVVETAQTGVPFGRRFSKIYAPFRLIAAVGLLVPLNYGFNGSQYITFYAAKLGSSMATNGWILFNSTLDNPMGVTNAELIARSTAPDISGLAYFSSVYHACREMYKIYAPKYYLHQNGGPSDAGSAGGAQGGNAIIIKPYVIINGKAEEFISDGNGGSDYSYTEAKKAFGSSDMEVILGEQDDKLHPSDPGGVRPYCGKVTLSLANQNPPYFTNGTVTAGSGHGGGSAGTPSTTQNGGVERIEQNYYFLLQNLLSTRGKFAAIGERAAHVFVPSKDVSEGGQHDTCWRSGDLGDGGLADSAGGGSLLGNDIGSGPGSSMGCKVYMFPSSGSFTKDLQSYKTGIDASITQALTDMQGNMDLKLSDELKAMGWGGAGVWYDRVAEMNGSVTGAIYAAPTGKTMPEVLENVLKEKKTSDTSTDACKTFSPNVSNNQALPYSTNTSDAIAKATSAMYEYWNCDGRGSEETPVPKGASSNVVLDVIGVIFGVNGLFHLREDTTVNEDTGRAKTHPLAALSAIGKSLVENAIRSMAISIGASFGGGMTAILGSGLGAALGNISKMFVSVATIGLTTGFILYYILPFMPFIYFFFAVGSWVKSIFEAMVGAPLWALAHLRIDGDGFSGKAAASGYFLIFEIFIRPIVTVFGLIGGIAVFGSMVTVMNSVFDLVVQNVVGDNPDSDPNSAIATDGSNVISLGTIDQFFFTVVYAILVYMIATASFKMIDTIPKQIMRWMGSGISTFNDNTGDPTANLTQYTGLAGSRYVPQIFSGIDQGAGALSGAINVAAKIAKGGDEKSSGSD